MIFSLFNFSSCFLTWNSLKNVKKLFRMNPPVNTRFFRKRGGAVKATHVSVSVSCCRGDGVNICTFLRFFLFIFRCHIWETNGGLWLDDVPRPCKALIQSEVAVFDLDALDAAPFLPNVSVSLCVFLLLCEKRGIFCTFPVVVL